MRAWPRSLRALFAALVAILVLTLAALAWRPYGPLAAPRRVASVTDATWSGRTAVLAAAAGLAALLALAYGTDRLLVARVRRVARSAERIARGEADRTGLRHDEDGLGRLAAALDALAKDVAGDRERSERSLAELARQEEHYRLLAENMSDVVALHEPEGRYTYVSPSVREVLGYSPQELLGTDAYALFHPDDVARVQRETRDQVLKHDGAVRVEYRIRNKAGAYLWFETTKRALLDPQGDISVLETVSRDVTQRREAVEALERSEERFRSLVLNGSDIITLLDANGRVSYASPAFEAVTGRTSESIVNADVFELVHPDDRAAVRRSFDELRGQHKVAVAPFRFRTAAGEWVWLESIGMNLLANPAVGAIVVNSRDVTEKLQAEADRERYTRELERSNRELQDFAYVASHDLQEPLRKIQAFGDRLGKHSGQALDARGRDYLTRMQDAATRMRALIEDLLTFSRVTTHARPFESVDLNAVLGEAEDVLSERLAETGGTVRSDDLPVIEADPRQMLELFQNLLANALKYHREGVLPHVEVRARSEADEAGTGRVVVEVEDNGIGFEPQYGEKIFGIFQRLHGRGAYEGNGVGLAVCRKIVERHGGSIDARGRPGEGATFVVTLPVGQERKGSPT